MVERSFSCRGTDRSNLTISEHGYNRRLPPTRSHSTLSSGLNGSSLQSNSFRNPSNSTNNLGHSSLHTRGFHRNKSFNKPKLTASNSGYDPLGGNSNHSCRSMGSFQHSYKKPVMPQKHQYAAMDCEMVGTVTGASVAARVVLIDWKGRPILDSYMKPNEEVADYRTFVSGITKENLEDAPTFDEVVQKVKDMLEDKILIGHGVDNDLRALGITHPWLMTRDTAYYQPFMRLLETSTTNNLALSQQNGRAEPVWGPRKLKDLAKEKLQRDIQVAGVSHCPIEDAAAALDLYKSHRPRWEACMSTEEKQQQQQALQMAAAQAAYEMSMMPSHSSPSSSYATCPSRTSSSTSSSVSSFEDLSLSVHSYFDGPNDNGRMPLYPLSVSNHSPPPKAQLQTGYLPHHPSQSELDAKYLGLGKKTRDPLDSWSQHGPIGRQVRRSGSGDLCVYEPRQQLHEGDSSHNVYLPPHRRQLHRQLSLGYPPSSSSPPSSHIASSSFYSPSGHFGTNCIVENNSESNTAVY